MNRFLIIARVGDRSLHPNWLLGDTPRFDIFISYFGDEPNKYSEHAQFYEQKKGGKWPELGRILQENAELISKYEAVWMPDDDLKCSADEVNRMFDFFTAFELDLAQPALSLNSYFSHPHLLQQPNSVIRYCNFVEVMAPIFSQKALKQLSHTLIQSHSGWGLDFLWPHLLENQKKDKIAIIDQISVVHTRPVGGELYKKNPNMCPKSDRQKLYQTYDKLKLSHRDYVNKFRVYSQAKLNNTHADWRAVIIGKWQRVKAKYRGKWCNKYPN